MINILLKNPIKSAILICLLFFMTAGIFFNEKIASLSEIFFLFISAFLVTLEKTSIRRLTIILSTLVLFLLHLVLQNSSGFIFVAEIGLLLLFTYLNISEKNIFIFSIIASAFLLHLYYILNTSIDVRQHDLNGILLYMQQISLDGFNWKNFDPWYMYYLFHQPLHFLILAYIYKLELFLGVSIFVSLENLQYVSLCYVTLSTIVAVGILKELGISGKSLYATLLLYAFNPTLILISGYISDDTSAFFAGMVIIYFSICWYKKEQTHSIVILALSFGLGVLCKLSILMLVPALTFLFLYKLYSSDNKKKIIQQLSYFIIIAVPIALFWIIRNHILFDMQFYNVPDTSPMGQNFKFLTFTERLEDFSQFSSPFMNAPIVNEANIWLALIKTELFGEWNLSLNNTMVSFPALILYILNIVIKIVSLISIIILLIRFIQQKQVSVLLCFFMIIYITIWGYSFKYSMDYPYICSSNYRLFAQLIFPEVVILSTVAASPLKKNIFLIFSGIYSLLSLIIYTVAV